MAFMMKFGIKWWLKIVPSKLTELPLSLFSITSFFLTPDLHTPWIWHNILFIYSTFSTKDEHDTSTTLSRRKQYTRSMAVLGWPSSFNSSSFQMFYTDNISAWELCRSKISYYIQIKILCITFFFSIKEILILLITISDT